READAQRVSSKLPRIELDADGQALNDLDPVAGRVLRRDQREGRTGAAGESGDLAMVDKIVAVEVGDEFDALARTDLLELAFLEVGVDVDASDRDNGHDRRAGGDPLAD